MDRFESLKLLYTSGLVKAPNIVLMALATTDFSGVANKYLIKNLGLSSVTVTQSVDALVNKGLVSRFFPYRDRRTVTLHLSTAGREKAENLLSVLRCVAAAIAV